MAADLSGRTGDAEPKSFLPLLVAGEPGPSVEPQPVEAQYRTAGKIPDTVLDGWAGPAFTLRAGTVRGRMHRHNGQPRQDAFAVRTNEDGGSVYIAIADGVSSAKYAHAGSQAAVEYAVSWMAQRYSFEFDEQSAWELLKGASWEISQRAQKAGADAADFATTLVCVAATRAVDGVVGHAVSVGDSLAWVFGSDGSLTPLVGGKQLDATVSSSLVHPLPFLPDELDVSGFTASPDDVVLVGSDGIGDPLGGGGGPLNSLLAERLIGRVPSMIEFGHLLDFSKSGFDDDRVLVALWPRQSNAFEKKL